MRDLPVAIIGAGLSGAACAQTLLAAGRRVTLFDKSRGSGGRLASKRIGAHSINLGAQSFHARTTAFREQLREWTTAGLLEERGDGWWPRANTSQLTRALMQGATFIPAIGIDSIQLDDCELVLLDTDRQHHGNFSAAIITAPAAQAAHLLRHDAALSARCQIAAFAPAWVAVFAAAQAWRHDAPLPTIVARITSRRIDGAYQWVVEASADWSSAEIERDPQWIAFALQAALAASSLDLLHCHRWRFARVTRALGQPYIWQAPLGLCGDWLDGSDAESAWRSGRALAQAILATNLS
jgi:predicted NAD/FAD-dependent oxidoreductase